MGVVAGAEGKLGSLLGPHADKITTSVGLFAVTTATMYASSLNGQARRQFQVGHPENVPLEGTKDDRIRFLNAGRGLYNLLEQAPGFFLNVWAAREIGESPILAGALLSVWSVGRILYAKNYAEKGPSGRLTGFMIAMLASSPRLACRSSTPSKRSLLELKVREREAVCVEIAHRWSHNDSKCSSFRKLKK